MRWKIETFYKILKSGCRAEDSRLRTADRLTNLIAICCILSWRIFWLTMLNRAAPDTSPSEAFTDVEIAVLDQPSPTSTVPEFLPRTLSHYTIELAKLGGYLAREGDPPLGNIVMWRGFTRLTDIVLGMRFGRKLWVIKSHTARLLLRRTSMTMSGAGLAGAGSCSGANVDAGNDAPAFVERS